MGTDDPQQFARQLRLERERLADADIPDADRQAIQQWARRRDGQVAISTLSTYMQRLRKAATWSGTPLTDLDEDAYHDLVWRLRHDADYADSSVRNIENTLCVWLTGHRGLDWPDNIDRTPTGDAGPSPSDMLRGADIAALLDGATAQRDVALIEFLADTGARIGLTCSLRVQDVSLDGDRPTFTPNPNSQANKGVTDIPRPLIDSRAPIRTYLRQAHPRSGDPEAALFHKLKGYGDSVAEDDGALEPSPLTAHLKRIADRAGVDKPVNPHNFRHSAITRMVREGYGRAAIEHRVGWIVDTDMWSTYQHLSADEHNDDIFAEAGFIDTDAGQTQGRRRCGNCGESLAPHHDHCPSCGEAATPEARERQRDRVDRLLDALADASDSLERTDLRILTDATRSHPSAHESASRSANSSGSQS